MNLFNIQKSLKMKAERGWDTIYVAVDAHGTMVRPYHDTLQFYPGAVEVLRWFSNRTDFKLILWTSSHIEEIVELIEFAEKNGIVFDAANKNPFEKNTKTADFREKFYFNILLDDTCLSGCFSKTLGVVPEPRPSPVRIAVRWGRLKQPDKQEMTRLVFHLKMEIGFILKMN